MRFNIQLDNLKFFQLLLQKWENLQIVQLKIFRFLRNCALVMLVAELRPLYYLRL